MLKLQFNQALVTLTTIFSLNFDILKTNNGPNGALIKDAMHTFSPDSVNWPVPNTFSTKIQEFAKKNCLEIVLVMKIFLIANQNVELRVSKHNFFKRLKK